RHRAGGPALPGPHVLPRRHALARGRGPAADPDHRRGRVQRDLLRRRRGARRERDRRARAGLAGGDDDAHARAGGARVRALGRVRGRRREAARARARPPARRPAPRPDRPIVDRAPGAEVDELPGAHPSDGDRCPGARGIRPEAALVGGQPAAGQARARAARAGGAGDGRRRLLAVAPAAQPGQHDRGRDLGDPAEHRRRARARAAEGALSVHFAFTPEQDALRTEARRWLEERYPAERVAELADSEVGWDPASWAELAELGWLGVSVPEDEGGAGLGFLEEAVLLEELGRALYPGPYFSTVGLALPALGPDERAEVAAGRVRWSAEIDGLVPDLALVDRVVTGEGATAAEGETLPTMDSTRRL